jgi:hypothetical protein
VKAGSSGPVSVMRLVIVESPYAGNIELNVTYARSLLGLE